MRKSLFFALLAALALAVLTADAQGRKKRVAVFDFDYATVRSASAAIFGQDIDVGKGISDLLIANLVKDGTYSVVERGSIDRILREQNFSNSDRANPASAARIGRLLGVDAIIVGSITQFGNETTKQNYGGSGGNWGGYGVGGFGHKKTKAIVEVSARLVDIDTAEILAVAAGHGESKRESVSMLGGGGSWHGWGTGNVNFGASDFQSTIIGEAIKMSVDQLTGGVIAGQTKLQTRAAAISGLIAAVEDGQIVLNIGSSCGLAVGDQLTVERLSREVKDPATGKVIRRIAAAVGVVKVIEADEISSVAVPVSGSGFKVGDLVKARER